MKKLEEIVEALALKRFRGDVGDTIRAQMVFFNEHATFTEFEKFMNLRKKGAISCYNEQYGHLTLNALGSVITEFIVEVIWVRMKDEYIGLVVEELERTVDNSPTITVTIDIN